MDMVPRLDRALRSAALVGPDPGWRRLARWSGDNEVEGLPGTVQLQGAQIREELL